MRSEPRRRSQRGSSPRGGVRRRWVLLLPLLPLLPPLQQSSVIDSGAFVITRGAEVVGREEFAIRRGRTGSPDGYTVSSTAVYPPRRGQVTLAPVVELGPDSLPAAVQFDVLGSGQRRVLVHFGTRRITIRVVRPNGEAARELPAGDRHLVVDDSVFALYTVLPGRTEGELQLIAPRHERRSRARLIDRGTQRVNVGGVAQSLQHLRLESAEGARDLWFDADGRLVKVAAPSLGLVAERIEGLP